MHAYAAFAEIDAAEAWDARKAQIEADAAKVWGTGGAAGKENAPAPKVFSFVGKFC